MRKVVEWIIWISLTIAFLGWIALGVGKVYLISMIVSIVSVTYYFIKYFPLDVKEVKERNNDSKME